MIILVNLSLRYIFVLKAERIYNIKNRDFCKGLCLDDFEQLIFLLLKII